MAHAQTTATIRGRCSFVAMKTTTTHAASVQEEQRWKLHAALAPASVLMEFLHRAVDNVLPSCFLM